MSFLFGKLGGLDLIKIKRIQKKLLDIFAGVFICDHWSGSLKNLLITFLLMMEPPPEKVLSIGFHHFSLISVLKMLPEITVGVGLEKKR